MTLSGDTDIRYRRHPGLLASEAGRLQTTVPVSGRLYKSSVQVRRFNSGKGVTSAKENPQQQLRASESKKSTWFTLSIGSFSKCPEEKLIFQDIFRRIIERTFGWLM